MKNEYQFSFEKLRVWQESRNWIGTVYKLTERFPKSETFNLTSQLNRAAVSVATNLAEGAARTSSKDQAHFSGLSYSSLMESACLCILAADRSYISEQELLDQRTKISGLSNQINALRNTQAKR